MTAAVDLSGRKLPNVPDSVFYVPDFVTAEEESHILKSVYAVPKPKWTSLSNRRLQDYGGVPHEKGMILEKIPEWLRRYVDRVSRLDVFGGSAPNQILVNEYLPGQGIMPHTDGPLFYPTVTTISCGSHTVLEFHENDSSRSRVCSLLLEPRSLVVWRDDLYEKYLHSIAEKERDLITDDCCNLSACSGGVYRPGQVLERATRVSLTIRNVPKVLRVRLF